jgi:ribonuclease HII
MSYLIGVDEVGYGALAGPLYVCGVLAPIDWSMKGLADSKVLSRRRHQDIYERAKLDDQISFEVVVVEVEEINVHGIGAPLKRATVEAVKKLRKKQPKARAILDGNLDHPNLDDYLSVPDADSFVPCVMAAANIAKHLRDTKMIEYGRMHPAYGFEKHVGYGVPQHLESLKRHGVCPIHRLSYKPIKRVQEEGTLPDEVPGVQPVTDSVYAAWRKQMHGETS